jgi:hypothetical protein
MLHNKRLLLAGRERLSRRGVSLNLDCGGFGTPRSRSAGRYTASTRRVFNRVSPPIKPAAALFLGLLCASHNFACAQNIPAIDRIAQTAFADTIGLSRRSQTLEGFSAEGGELVSFFRRDTLVVAAAYYFGESGRALERLAFADGHPILLERITKEYDSRLSGRIAATRSQRVYFARNTDRPVMLRELVHGRWKETQLPTLRGPTEPYGEPLTITDVSTTLANLLACIRRGSDPCRPGS